MTSFVVRTGHPADWRPALDLLYAHLEPLPRRQQVDQVLASERAGRLCLDGLHLCEGPTGPVAAALVIESAGRTLLLFPPRFDPRLLANDRSQAEAALMHAIDDSARLRGARLIQALLAGGEADTQALLQAYGYERLTRMLHLQRPLAGWQPPVNEETLVDLEWIPFDPVLQPEFEAAVLRSYEGSLDCPELTGIRTPEEILASHRAQGEFAPEHWLVARLQGDVAGCLLLAGLPLLGVLEIAYVGVVPEARRAGLGRVLVRKALALAKDAGCRAVTLAVDERNRPARALYEREGFFSWDSREAYLRLIDAADGRTTLRFASD